MHPGGEHTAPLEALELVEDAQERLLRHFLDERREQRVIGRKPARKGHTEARAGSLAQVGQRGFAGGAIGAQIG